MPHYAAAKKFGVDLRNIYRHFPARDLPERHLQSPKTLASTWILVRTHEHGESKTIALQRLNDAAGTSYTLSRLGEWTRGILQPSSEIRVLMLIDVLPYITPGAATDGAGWRDIAELLA